MDEHDLVAVEDPLLVREGDLDLRVLVVDDLRHRLDGGLAPRARDATGPVSGKSVPILITFSWAGAGPEREPHQQQAGG